MTTVEVAAKFMALCHEGNFLEVIDTLYDDGIVSVEPMDYQDKGSEMHGKQAVTDKNRTWFADNEVHKSTLSGPFVSPQRFAVRYGFDFTRKASGERVILDEVGVYTVVNGKICREEFLYSELKVNGVDLPQHLWGGGQA